MIYSDDKKQKYWDESMKEITVYFDSGSDSKPLQKKQYRIFQSYLKKYMKKLRNKEISSVEYNESNYTTASFDKFGNEREVIKGVFLIDETKPINPRNLF